MEKKNFKYPFRSVVWRFTLFTQSKVPGCGGEPDRPGSWFPSADINKIGGWPRWLRNITFSKAVHPSGGDSGGGFRSFAS